MIDSRGHGRSSLGRTPVSYRLLAEDAFTVMQALSIDQACVAGWSDGGNVGLLLALKHPERVQALVAISANAHSDGLTDSALQSISAMQDAEPGLLTRLLYRWQAPEPRSLPRVRESVLAMWQQGPLISDTELASIRVPTLLLIGESDDVAVGARTGDGGQNARSAT